MRALTLFSLGVIGLSLISCSDGGGGDTIAPFEGNVLGGGRSLASINRLVNEDGSENRRPGPNDVLNVTGVRVTWVDQYDETRDGRSVGNIFLQDFTAQAGPFEGVLAFQSSYSPPSFRASVGDVVDITGQYTEFQLSAANSQYPGWTTPEFVGGNIALRFDAPYIPIEPVEIPLSDLADYSTGRQWLGMVVTVRDVPLVDDLKVPAPPGETRIALKLNAVTGVSTNPQLTNELFNIRTVLEPEKSKRNITSYQGYRLARVTGVVTLAFGLHVAPRSAEDIEFSEP